MGPKVTVSVPVLVPEVKVVKTEPPVGWQHPAEKVIAEVTCEVAV